MSLLSCTLSLFTITISQEGNLVWFCHSIPAWGKLHLPFTTRHSPSTRRFGLGLVFLNIFIMPKPPIDAGCEQTPERWAHVLVEYWSVSELNNERAGKSCPVLGHRLLDALELVPNSPGQVPVMKQDWKYSSAAPHCLEMLHTTGYYQTLGE